MKMMNAIGAGISTSAIANRRRKSSSTAPPIAASIGPQPSPQVNVHR